MLKLQAPALDIHTLSRWRLYIRLTLALVSVRGTEGLLVQVALLGARRWKKHASMTATIMLRYKVSVSDCSRYLRLSTCSSSDAMRTVRCGQRRGDMCNSADCETVRSVDI